MIFGRNRKSRRTLPDTTQNYYIPLPVNSPLYLILPSQFKDGLDGFLLAALVVQAEQSARCVRVSVSEK